MERELRCLRQSAADIATTEQTMELRLPENKPPIGRVLGAWGQCLLRGKEWQGDRVAVNGGVVVNALYESEGGGSLESVQGWLPFQLSWELNDSHRDGTMVVSCVVREVDARQIGAEKLILRASVSAMAQALEEESYPWWDAGDATGDMQLLKQELRFCLPMEAGERKFQLEETLQPSPGQMDMERLLFGQLIPSVKEAKVMEDKLVFRGSAAYHVVYLGADGMLHVWEGELPMSQLDQLQQEYSPEAELWVDPLITDLEFTAMEGGGLGIKADVLAQYVVYDHSVVSVVTDAYCPNCPVELQWQQVMFPGVKERRMEQITLSSSIAENASQLAEGTVALGQPRLNASDGMLEGSMSALFYDEDNRLQTARTAVNQTFPLTEGNWQGWLLPQQKIQGSLGAEEIRLNANVGVMLLSMEDAGVSMICGITVGEPENKAGKPGLILRKAGNMSLWELAKKCGSTVAAIEEANGLEGQPEAERMLLIPVK